MKNFRKYGARPYKIAVVHGGPGAPGSVTPVARELAADAGILEPLQTKDSLEGQIQELHDVLNEHADLPVILIGHSWGAVLSYLTTTRFPHLIKKLILVGMPPLDAKSLPDKYAVWLSRLSETDRVEFLSLEKFVWDGVAEDKSASMGRLFRLIAKADSYEQVLCKDETLKYQLDINIPVGLELRKLQQSGDLIEMGKKIKCPVVAIHGDYDPRPAEGVKLPLSHVIKDFKFILLEKCGHYPWLERCARDEFYKILRNELK